VEILNLIPVAGGVALLLFGRRLFWLLVASAGFLAGFTFVTLFLEEPSTTSALVAGLLAGAAGALIALFAQKVAVTLGGFLAGGYGLMVLAGGVPGISSIPEWIPFLVGGVIGAFLIRIVFEWTLIVLTSLIGAILVTHFLSVGPAFLVPLTVLVAVVGIVIQARSKRRK